MIKLLLVDDELPALQVMETFLQPLREQVTVCGACTGIQQAVSSIAQHSPDIILLDVELGDGLGFEILEHFPHADMRIIFVTAHDDYILRAIKFHAFDYLFKPLEASELLLAVKKAMDDIRHKRPAQPSAALLDYLKARPAAKIAVPTREGLNYYSIADLIYIEADGSYAVMHFADEKPITITRKIKDFETALADKGFLRVHKSFLVNMNHITQLHREDSGYLIMSNQARISISPKNKEQIIGKIKQFCIVI
jgi:two-component system LytT family response regulator